MTDKIKPKHYNIKGRKECIEEMADMFGIEHVRAFCLLNIQKYIYRYEEKNGEEDIQKAKEYKNMFLKYGGDINHVFLLEDVYGIRL